mmetsp:Transcript_5011/g.9798  ORF Transcript_5011/g.9798 Transcript_5011/m.9798 type:complete len:186 (+) Transcript_5011:1016-1573(+)
MKYHPDRMRRDDSNGAEAAKKRTTAKFSEISAAYELLSSGGDASGDGVSGASHPSFANAESDPTSRYPATSNYQTGTSPFSSRVDPFGFGTFDNYSDPFELFRRTFGDIGALNEHVGMFPPFVNTPSSPAMHAPSVGGFTSFGSIMNREFPTHSASSYSSSTCFGGAHHGGPSSRQPRLLSMERP